MEDKKIGILYLELAGRIIEKSNEHGCITREEVNNILSRTFHIRKNKWPIVIKELQLSNFLVIASSNNHRIIFKINSPSAIKKRQENISGLYHAIGLY